MILHKSTLKKIIIRTPLIPFYNDATESFKAQLYLKPENLQIFGSYKIRGIANVIEESDPVVLRNGLSAASAGNMAQAVAYAAQKMNIPCRIFIPDSAPDVKKERIMQLGAQLIELPYQTIWQMVKENPSHPGNIGVFVHPAYHSSLLKGYSVIAHEIIEDMPDVDAVVIPFGVGGLSIGVGTAIYRLKPDVAIYACEPDTAAPLKKSLRLGKPSSVQRIPSFVDAIGTPEVLPGVYKLLAPILEDSIVVSLAEIKNSLKLLLMANKLLCEGAAACSAAAAIQLAEMGKHKKIVCILTGGNLPLTEIPL